MRYFFVILVVLLLGVVGFAYYRSWLIIELNYPPKFESPLASSENLNLESRSLDEFSFDSLKSREYQGSPIILERVLDQRSEYTAYLFSYQSDGRKVTGQANIPLPQEGSEKMPVIVMLRGFVDRDIYQTGIGTRNAARVFVENGYVTLAPDFLGYGESDPPEDDVWWERLNKPVQVMNLLASLESLSQIDTSRVGLWGHSNGGQIALSVLEISGKDYPTTLWAPVSKPFPYSILYYTDEFDDQGLHLRYELAEFERLYDVNKYSISEYFDLIQSPIQLHQGTADDAVPVRWSNELAESLRDLGVEVNYFVYPEAGHNMVESNSIRGSWNTVVERDVEFYERELKGSGL